MNRPLAVLLLFSFALSPFTQAADDSSSSIGSIASTAATGLSTALTDANGVFNNVVGSNLSQFQSLATRLQNVSQQNANLTQPQTAFNQVQVQLQLAVTQAQTCLAQVQNTTYDKYYAKRPADQKEIVKTIAPSALTSVEPTCTTYGVILDAIELNKAKLLDENRKMACLVNFQAKVDQVAEAAKAPFNALHEAADQVYQTYEQIIGVHNQIANKLGDELDGPADKDGARTGKGGYREELGKLKAMKLELNNVLNGAQGQQNSDNLAYGLVGEVEGLQQSRATAGNKWYYTLSSDTESCFQSRPVKCFGNDSVMPPNQCIAAYISNQGVGANASAGMRARAADDIQNGLSNINVQNSVKGQSINVPGNIDIADPNAFLKFSKDRFTTTLSSYLATYAGHQFFSSVDASAIQGMVRSAYIYCYATSVENFKADLASKGGRYYQDITATKQAERKVFNDEKNWVDRVEGEMTTFRTMFQKVYKSDIAQFKSDCTAGEDPYKGLDCLRVLNAELDSGVRGTRVVAQLSNGSNFVSVAGETSIPVQTLTLDTSGKPTIGSSTIQCAGFDDCINYLDRARQQHADAAQASTSDEKKFVQQNNQAVKTAFGAISGVFTQMSQLLTGSIGVINQDLAALGITGQVKAKKVESEALVLNEKTGLYDTPKSMIAAFAGQGSYTQIDDTQTVTDSINTLLTDLSKKAGDAQKMKLKCKVSKADYDALAKMMPADCSKAKDVCNAFGPSSAARFSQFLATLNSSRETPEDNAHNNLMSDYSNCRSQMLTANNVTEPSEDDVLLAADNSGHPLTATGTDGNIDINTSNYRRARALAVQQAKADAQSDTQAQCSSVLFPPLVQAANSDRKSLKDQNTGLVTSLEDVSKACSTLVPDKKTHKLPDEDDNVSKMCEEFKTRANAAQGPTGEEETGTIAKPENTQQTSPDAIFTPATAK